MLKQTLRGSVAVRRAGGKSEQAEKGALFVSIPLHSAFKNNCDGAFVALAREDPPSSTLTRASTKD